MLLENEKDHGHKANRTETTHLAIRFLHWNIFQFSIPLVDVLVGDAVVNRIPRGLIYSLLFDDVWPIIDSWDCASTCTFIDDWCVWRMFGDDSSKDGTIIGKTFCKFGSLIKLDWFSSLVASLFLGGQIAVALSIAVGW